MFRKELYKDMEKYKKTKRAYKRSYAYRNGCYNFEKRPWTDKEDDLVIEHRMPDSELVWIINRSLQAIQTRRVRLRKDGRL
jgi:hypothetical protein